MFTGIVEGLGVVKKIEKEGENIHFTIESPFTDELKIDQSVAHNGCCLTVVGIDGSEYVVTAILETLEKTNLGQWTEGDEGKPRTLHGHEWSFGWSYCSRSCRYHCNMHGN